MAYEAGKPLVVEELEAPAVGPTDVLVRVAASGICHTDHAAVAGSTPIPFPFVPGHEGCGTVEEVGRRRPPGEGRSTGPRLGRPRVRRMLVVRELALESVRSGSGREVGAAVGAPRRRPWRRPCAGAGPSPR